MKPRPPRIKPPLASPARSASKPLRKRRVTNAPEPRKDPVFEALRGELGL